MDLRHDKVGTESRSGIKRSSEDLSGIELARSRVRTGVFASGRHDSIQQARARQQAIFHPRQLFPANSFIIHEISSSSSFSLHRSCSPREIHSPPILLHNQGYPKVCPDSLNLLNAGDSFAGISSLSFHSLFSPTSDLIAMF
jgi:hypothetical protein